MTVNDNGGGARGGAPGLGEIGVRLYLPGANFDAKSAILPAMDCQTVARVILILNLNRRLKRLVRARPVRFHDRTR